MVRKQGTQLAQTRKRGSKRDSRSNSNVDSNVDLKVDSKVDFFERVFSVVAQIPRGRVTTYGHIAAALGARSSSRLVGWALNAAHAHPWVPAHRVINRNGELSGKMHFATPTLMRELLEAEDVEFEEERVRLSKHLWIPEIGRW